MKIKYSLAMLYLSSILPSTELHFVGILEAIYRLKCLSCRFDFYQQLKALNQGPRGFGSKIITSQIAFPREPIVTC